MKTFKTLNGGSYKIYNPTNEAILIKYDGREMILDAFEEMEVENFAIHKFFLKKYKDRGLVDATWSEAAKARHKTFKDFFDAQCLLGLKNLRSFCAQTLAREQQAANESALKNGSALDNLLFKVGDFKSKVTSVDEAIEKFQKSMIAEKEKKSKNESRSNSAESTAQA